MKAGAALKISCGICCRYNSLKRTFECRLASLAAAVSSAITRVSGDEVLLQLKASETTVQFAQAHVQSLVDEHLNAERDGCFHDLANKVADAELEASRATLRNEELSSSVRILQEEAKRGERSRVEVAHVKSEIRELRHEYQVLNTPMQVGDEVITLCSDTSDCPAPLLYSQ